MLEVIVGAVVIYYCDFSALRKPRKKERCKVTVFWWKRVQAGEKVLVYFLM